jgi:hypothetical protein
MQNPHALPRNRVGLRLFSGTGIARLFLAGMISLKTEPPVARTPDPDRRTRPAKKAQDHNG